MKVEVVVGNTGRQVSLKFQHSYTAHINKPGNSWKVHREMVGESELIVELSQNQKEKKK